MDPELMKLLEEQKGVDTKKKWLGAAGDALGAITSVQSPAEILLGMQRGQGHGDGLKNVASSLKDPMEREQKAMAYLKDRREGQQAQAEDERIAALKDPNSSASKAFLYQLKAGGVDVPADATAYDLFQQGYSPSKLAEINAQNRADMRKMAFQQNFQASQAEKDRLAKSMEVDKTKVKDDREFSDRQKNIMQQVGEVKDLVNKYGTSEKWTPGVEEAMNAKITAIATDAAKLFDPQSVARESEVAAFKSMLFEPGTTMMRDSTAINGLDAFADMIQKRAANRFNDPSMVGQAPEFMQEAAAQSAKAEPKTIVKKQVNKALGKTRIVYSDGSVEEIDGIK